MLDSRGPGCCVRLEGLRATGALPGETSLLRLDGSGLFSAAATGIVFVDEYVDELSRVGAGSGQLGLSMLFICGEDLAVVWFDDAVPGRIEPVAGASAGFGARLGCAGAKEGRVAGTVGLGGEDVVLDMLKGSFSYESFPKSRGGSVGDCVARGATGTPGLRVVSMLRVVSTLPGAPRRPRPC